MTGSFLILFAATASPVEGRLAVSAFPIAGERITANLGLEGEVGPRGGPFAVGFTTWALGENNLAYGPLGRQIAATAFVRGRLALTERDEVSALVGPHYRYQRYELCPGTCVEPVSLGWIMGVAWHHTTERYWLRVTPQVDFAWQPWLATGGFTSWGLPWVEVGWWFTPSFGLGARAGPGIAQGVWRF